MGSLDVAADNAATGADMLSTLEDHYALISQHMQRVRDLTEQAANGTYGSQSLAAINSEITARLEEIDRIAANCEFSGQYMMDGSLKSGLAIQVGTDSNTTKSQIELKGDLFRRADVMALRVAKDTDVDDEVPRKDVTDAQMEASRKEFAKCCSGYDVENGRMTTADNEKPAAMLAKIDEMINTISDRITTLGAAQNRIESAIESIGVQSENITSSLSTLRDADVAQESSNYIKAQILQQASATLLATANQTPSIALNLL